MVDIQFTAVAVEKMIYIERMAQPQWSLTAVALSHRIATPSFALPKSSIYIAVLRQALHQDCPADSSRNHATRTAAVASAHVFGYDKQVLANVFL